jgi:7 transmembrane helices usually fused to an inactive transglutaminase/Inactive transglutaminase fused to 7 transmembrane helices/Transglutaminase-like superfamily
MKQRYVYVLAILLTAIGLSVFYYKWQVLSFPLTEDQDAPVWTIEAAINFQSGPGSIKVQLHVPTLTPGFRMLNENSVSRGYGFSLNYGSGGREAQWAIRRADGEQTIYYRLSVYEDDSVDETDTTPPFPPRPVINEPMNTAVEVLVSDVRQHSADTASFTTELLRRLNDPTPDTNVELLRSGVSSNADFVDRATMLLAAARIPARAVHGFPLSDRQRNASMVSWLEVHDGDRWLYFNPATGEETLPKRFFVWWRGNEPLVSVEGGSKVQVDFSIQQNYLDAIAIAETQAAQQGASAFDFSLYSLPIRTQAVYAVLLMIPIGALVMVVMRNMVGIDAFGTFMPVLIALAFRETKLIWGVVLFTLLITLGLTIRFLLDRLRLLLVPRLSAVLIVVVLLMLIISLTSHQLGLNSGLSVALFPMVIIAMTIERMSIVWEERGPADAFRAGLGSLFVAVVAYTFMGLKWLEHLIFTFPELLLIVLALVMLAGRYTGYRLTELRRFKELARD